MQDIFPAAEKILSDVENIFKKDLNLSSFEIIPEEDNKNKSPVFHDENSLGLASWCIQPLYSYVYNRLLDLRENQHRREEPVLISRWLLGALLLNPDVSTFWNMRRELARNGRLDPLEELRFVNIVLYYKPKCFEAFSYRRWILKLILTDHRELENDADLLFRNEIQVASMAADRYRNNCHAWSHREQIISMLEKLSPHRLKTVLDIEWTESTKWCYSHVSDYSGFVYRQFLLKRLLLREDDAEQLKLQPEILSKRQEVVLEFVKTVTRGCNDVFLLQNGSNEEILNLLHGLTVSKCNDVRCDQTLINLSYWVEDCIVNEELISNFTGHEALWYHRKFLVFCLLALNNSYKRSAVYKTESLNPLETIRRQNEKFENLNSTITSDSSTRSLLEIAFSSRNKLLIDAARRHGSQQNNLAEKFFNFSICMNLES